ncbi:hypothetical protein L873DRAFT_406857 [Choiromyces venosus 120613-1]|uniref:Uncharacterized protein n=1 Tax=Choiromyces venosus 120613-1 TaxID=1336337 RepID=A0A3N4JVV9_9PEZI|nr:hypothetical protein L873DRAFT_406857 [Choiromyces venosus 120613-1]
MFATGRYPLFSSLLAVAIDVVKVDFSMGMRSYPHCFISLHDHQNMLLFPVQSCFPKISFLEVKLTLSFALSLSIYNSHYTRIQSHVHPHAITVPYAYLLPLLHHTGTYCTVTT